MSLASKGFRFIAFSLLLATARPAYAQDKQAEIKNSIESRHFVFHAQTALPMTGKARQLTTDYNLKIDTNTLVSYLPFFGRAYTLSSNQTGSGYDFSSSKFDYVANPNKKGGWEISIKPKDVQDFREFALSISKDGYGTLQALSNNRQPISFTGYVSTIK